LPEVLERHGFFQEALLLADAHLVGWAEEQVLHGSCVSIFSPVYPSVWLAKLGALAPPVFWLEGAMPSGRFIGLVGSRSPSPASVSFTRACGARIAQSGAVLVSGGATGCDAIGAASYSRAGGADTVTILPRGILPSDESDGCLICLEAPGTPFDRLAALARNSLIYALSEVSIVVQPRFREGGTWQGAFSALRSSLCRIFVMDEPSNRACSALCSLGASSLPMDDVSLHSSFNNALSDRSSQPSLFSAIS
jgi:predicted Rossmann fold nucleotide-binding protein DprA/Smf involved in DNA uptake